MIIHAIQQARKLEAKRANSYDNSITSKIKGFQGHQGQTNIIIKMHLTSIVAETSQIHFEHVLIIPTKL